MEGIDQWEKQKGNPTESFHMDPKKEIDPAEQLVAERGVEGALAEIERRLAGNPNDEEARRQASLIINRTDDIAERAAALKRMIQH